MTSSLLNTHGYRRPDRLSSWRRFVFIGVVTIALAICVVESATQYLQNKVIQTIAQDVTQKAGANDNRARILALRDYVRANVSFFDAQQESRPFFRDSATETLSSGKGYCGEDTRVFICLAAAVGIRSQRINLWGTEPHVVAEAELSPDERVIVDCQNPPKVRDLETLDRVILRPEFTDYYTLNLRRLQLHGVVSRVKLQMGILTYWTENPHALKALLWLMLASSLVLCWLMLKSVRKLSRAALRRRGWIHISNTQEIATAATMLKQAREASDEQPSTKPPSSLATPVSSRPIELSNQEIEQSGSANLIS